MAFRMLPPGLHWGWGLLAGSAGPLLAGAGARLVEPDDQDARQTYQLVATGGAGLLIGGIMVAFKPSRTAGWAALGAAAGVSVLTYLAQKTSVFAGDNMGLTVAQEISGDPPVEVLSNGGNGLGLMVAQEIKGELGQAPVDILGANNGVEILGNASGFGTSFGGNFTTNR